MRSLRETFLPGALSGVSFRHIHVDPTSLTLTVQCNGVERAVNTLRD